MINFVELIYCWVVGKSETPSAVENPEGGWVKRLKLAKIILLLIRYIFPKNIINY